MTIQNYLATHTLIDLDECDPSLLDNLEYVRLSLIEASTEAKATILSDKFHKFDPIGVTGFVTLAESHISVHTWPEYAFATVDILSCGNSMDPVIATKYIISKFKCAKASIKKYKRGEVKNFKIGDESSI